MVFLRIDKEDYFNRIQHDWSYRRINVYFPLRHAVIETRKTLLNQAKRLLTVVFFVTENHIRSWSVLTKIVNQIRIHKISTKEVERNIFFKKKRVLYIQKKKSLPCEIPERCKKRDNNQLIREKQDLFLMFLNLTL